MNIYAKCVKSPNNTNQDMQEKRQSAHVSLFEYLYCSDLENKVKVTKI